jgi:phosphomannomutase
LSNLMRSASGIRGIVGETLTPENITKHVYAFATLLSGKDVVLGGDPRTSNSFIRPLVKSTLMSCGINVIDIGITPTPTVQIAVEKLKATGGIAITASHNPIEWNGVKFIGPYGLFLPQDVINKLFEVADSPEREYVGWKSLGKKEIYSDAIDDHLEKIYSLPYINVEQIRKKKFKVGLDCVNGAGGLIIPKLLEHFGCEIVGINLEPTGIFAHTPEPLPQNLKDLARLVQENNCHIGFAVDPDVDRCAIIGNDGSPLGEEYTLAIAVKFILSQKLGHVVINLSTSRAIDEIVQYYNSVLHRTKVGEINVAEKMREMDAVIGGEGNGGVILPEVHLGRDAPVAVALTLQQLAEFDGTIAQFKQTLPQYYILKDKAPLGSASSVVDPDKVIKHFSELFKTEQLNSTDGLRIDHGDYWIHLRESNTEPIMRIIVEARTPEKSWQILQQTKETISKL